MSKFALSPKKVSANWWNKNWTYRKNITINSNSNQADVYVKITLNTSDKSRFQDNCGDIRFVDQSNNVLNYYLIDCGKKNTSININIPNLINGTNNFSLYYGNKLISNGSNQTDFSKEAKDVKLVLNKEEKLFFKKNKIKTSTVKEVEKKYEISKNTFSRNVKSNLKDRIEVEVGDKENNSFEPKVKLKRWDGEVSMSVNLVDDENVQPIISADKETIKWSKEKREIKFYELPSSETFPEGGYEFEITLKEKPTTNKVQFNLETKGLEFFYQPEPTKEEKANGVIRPENVIGSYAVYYKNAPLNIKGQKEYKVGKAFHIYRPKVVDAKGKWVWGVLNIDENNGFLTVTIPQEFLDNATYPVTHAAGLTMGYTSVGASPNGYIGNRMFGQHTIAPISGTIASITGYFDNYNGVNIKAALVNSSLNIVTNGISNPIYTNSINGSWLNLPFATPPSVTASSQYYLMAIGDTAIGYKYDVGNSNPENYTRIDTSNSYSSPTNPTDATIYEIKQSVYATYVSSLSQNSFRWRNDNGSEAAPTAGAISFSGGSTYSTGTYPNVVVSADFNGDGYKDLATNNSSSSNISVFINNGNGTFGTGVNYSVSSTNYSIDTGYFNNDSYPDLVVPEYGSGRMYVFINNGNGTFGTGVTYPITGSANSVSVGDLNGDGRDDIVTAVSSSYKACVSMNNGSGVFGSQTCYGSTSSSGIDIGDFNNDGYGDIVASSSSYAYVSIFTNNGNGTFGAGTTYPVNASAFAAAGDLNGDGYDEIVTASASSNVATVIMNNGNGTFGSSTNYTLLGNSYHWHIYIGDLSNDGYNEIAFVNGTPTDTVNVLTNNGNGTFGTRIDVTTGSNPAGVNIADFNNDYKNDLVVANNFGNTISVFLNNTTMSGGASWKAPENINITDVAKNSNIRLRFSIKNTASANTFNFKLQGAPKGTASSCLNVGSTNFIDIPTTSGSFSIMTTSPNFTDQASTTNQLSNPLGTFSAGKIVEYSSNQASSVSISSNYFTELEYNFQMTSIASTGAAYCFRTVNNVGASFGSPTNYATGTDPRSAISADLNNDGLSDIAVANLITNNITIFKNNGANSFTSANYSAGTGVSYPVSITAGDFDNNGRVDLATANNASKNITVYTNDGSGGFSSNTVYALQTGVSKPISITNADFDGDNDLDLAVANSNGDAVSIFNNNGSGVFTAGTTYPTFGSDIKGVTTGDFNSDNKPDLAVANWATNNIAIFINKYGIGSSTFTTATTISIGSSWPISIATGDYDKDGKNDLFVTNYNSNNVTVLKNFYGIGSSNFAIASTHPVTGTYPYATATGDFNGDGCIDFATDSGGTSNFTLFTNNCAGGFSSGVSYTTPSVAWNIVTFNTTDKSLTDIVTVNSGGNTISVFKNLSLAIDTYSNIAQLTVSGVGATIPITPTPSPSPSPTPTTGPTPTPMVGGNGLKIEGLKFEGIKFN